MCIQCSKKVSNATNSYGYKTIQKTISEIYSSAFVSPFLVVAATDSRYFHYITENIYRFSVVKLNKRNIKSFHGLNENLPVSEFENSIRFYYQLIRNSNLP